MRPVAVVALSVLALGTGVVGAEARGFRLRGLGHASAPHAVPARAVPARSTPSVAAVELSYPLRSDTSVVTRSVLSTGTPGIAGETMAEDAAPIPPMPPAPVAARKPAEPWCRSGRVAGQGTGFCLIN